MNDNNQSKDKPLDQATLDQAAQEKQAAEQRKDEQRKDDQRRDDQRAEDQRREDQQKDDDRRRDDDRKRADRRKEKEEKAKEKETEEVVQTPDLDEPNDTSPEKDEREPDTEKRSQRDPGYRGPTTIGMVELNDGTGSFSVGPDGVLTEVSRETGDVRRDGLLVARNTVLPDNTRIREDFDTDTITIDGTSKSANEVDWRTFATDLAEKGASRETLSLIRDRLDRGDPKEKEQFYNDLMERHQSQSQSVVLNIAPQQHTYLENYGVSRDPIAIRMAKLDGSLERYEEALRNRADIQPSKAEPTKTEVEKAEPTKVEVEKAEPTKAEAEKATVQPDPTPTELPTNSIDSPTTPATPETAATPVQVEAPSTQPNQPAKDTEKAPTSEPAKDTEKAPTSETTQPNQPAKQHAKDTEKAPATPNTTEKTAEKTAEKAAETKPVHLTGEPKWREFAEQRAAAGAPREAITFIRDRFDKTPEKEPGEKAAFYDNLMERYQSKASVPREATKVADKADVTPTVGQAAGRRMEQEWEAQAVATPTPTPHRTHTKPTQPDVFKEYFATKKAPTVENGREQPDVFKEYFASKSAPTAEKSESEQQPAVFKEYFAGKPAPAPEPEKDPTLGGREEF